MTYLLENSLVCLVAIFVLMCLKRFNLVEHMMFELGKFCFFKGSFGSVFLLINKQVDHPMK